MRVWCHFHTKQVPYGVPQGLKLGPMPFFSHIAPISEVEQRRHVIDEKYADDEQLILTFESNFFEDKKKAVWKMDEYIPEIRDFLHKNILCDNGDKTELLIIGTRQQLNNITYH